MIHSSRGEMCSERFSAIFLGIVDQAGKAIAQQELAGLLVSDARDVPPEQRGGARVVGVVSRRWW